MSKEIKLPCYMMATKAIHKLGDISSDFEDICHVDKEEDGNYIGHWVAGLGFVNVKFPKETTRMLTTAEIEKFTKGVMMCTSGHTYKLNITQEGVDQ